MKKTSIIKKNTDFTKVLTYHHSYKNKYYSLYYMPNNKGLNQYGISIPTKTGKAHIRNKIKRQVKNIIDHNEKYIQTSYDYVIIIRKDILDIEYSTMETSLISLMQKIGAKK